MTGMGIEDFSEKDVSRFFIARNIDEAEHAESLLTENAISYAMEEEEFIDLNALAPGARMGVAFYVLSGQRNFCKELFLENGLAAGLLDIED